MEVPYQLDLQKGEYVCGLCKKRFPVAYRYRTQTPRTMSQRNGLPAQASANFNRHLASCYLKHKAAEAVRP